MEKTNEKNNNGNNYNLKKKKTLNYLKTIRRLFLLSVYDKIRKFNKKKWNKAPCRNCGWIIDREEAKAKTNILIRMRTFNRQMNCLFKLMEEVEYSTIQIAADYLHPEPVDLSSITT